MSNEYKYNEERRINYPLFDFSKIYEMPAPRVSRCEGDGVAKIQLRCPNSPTGEADLYVHRKCVEYSHGRGVDTTFNILLLDDDYPLVYPEMQQDGMWRNVRHKTDVKDILDMAEKTKIYYHKERANMTPKKRKIADLGPDDMYTRPDSEYSSLEFQ